MKSVKLRKYIRIKILILNVLISDVKDAKRKLNPDKYHLMQCKLKIFMISKLN